MYRICLNNHRDHKKANTPSMIAKASSIGGAKKSEETRAIARVAAARADAWAQRERLKDPQSQTVSYTLAKLETPVITGNTLSSDADSCMETEKSSRPA